VWVCLPISLVQYVSGPYHRRELGELVSPASDKVEDYVRGHACQSISPESIDSRADCAAMPCPSYPLLVAERGNALSCETERSE